MKINVMKMHSGILVPADDDGVDRMKRFKNNQAYTVDIKEFRNWEFHKKVFKFLRFCFAHWVSEHSEIQDEEKQFQVFRDNMTVLAGYYDTYYKINGETRVEARSISFDSMDQEEFEKYYSALINVALKHIFKTTDENTFNQLMSFF